MEKLINQIVKEEAGQATKKVEWPEEYIHRETGRKYEPHTEEEYDALVDDVTPYILVKGGEGCVSADTIIEGVPIAEWKGGGVETLAGRRYSTKSYLKGRADLYTVTTSSGKSVTTTLQHKFLTNRGWLPLQQFDNRTLVVNDSKKLEGVSSITFKEQGEFYDLSVPIGEHYFAHGLVHHNSGKTVFGIIKTLERVKRGMNGIVVSPNLPHFKRSLWPELRAFVPENVVIDRCKRMLSLEWVPSQPFRLILHNSLGSQSYIYCLGGANPLHIEGINAGFAHLDEARGLESAELLRVLAGRVRIDGPSGEPPQIWITTTPRKHWLYDFFGPPPPDGQPDPYKSFREQSRTITLKTKDNLKNLNEDYIKTRAASLTESQKRVRLGGEWEDEDNETSFIPSITLWDALKEDLPPVRKKSDQDKNWSDILVLSADAGVSRDSFALVAVSRHPDNREKVAVRDVKVWEPKHGEKIDFEGTEDDPGPEKYIRWLCKNYNCVCLVFDNYQLHQMSSRLSKDGVIWTQEFSQGRRRLLSDQNLYDLIIAANISHSGHHKLREHINNADAKIDAEEHKRRLVKRTESQKIDAAVACAMGAFEVMRLNL